ncbi:uncharacterized protein Tco025E_06334 [Trypanosoma conorhini]|uniref:Uncharacterized protein n=1 Tax=Trypanosoma conorhini TaxID=83891 RepID=A0A422P5M0_9TRYP|nr:uncharacterized protein Tco025E_06334 [Trypanosoma conorhini]RNF13011.1 hypothetical protein Tco025E_06334 [Trypanosoma conorhini]
MLHALLSTDSLPKNLAYTTLGSGGDGDRVHGGKQASVSVTQSLRDVGITQWGGVKAGGWFGRHSIFFGFMRVLGRRRLFIGLLVTLFMVVTVLMQTGLGTPEPDGALSKLQADLLACQSQLRVKKSPQ